MPECSGQVSLKPYAFVYNRKHFTKSENGITLLTASGAVTADINTAIAAVYLDSSTWSNDTISEVSALKQVEAPVGISRHLKKRPDPGPVPVDFRIK